MELTWDPRWQCVSHKSNNHASVHATIKPGESEVFVALYKDAETDFSWDIYDYYFALSSVK